jgi:signal transduction histidine kinase
MTTGHSDSHKEFPDPVSIDSQYHWLAHELHDGLLPWVVSARMQIESCLAKLEKDSSIESGLKSSLVCLNNALGEGRSLIGYLLDGHEHGSEELEAAIATHVTSMIPIARSRDQRLRFRPPDPQWPSISKQRAWAVVRWVQQALQNAIQHAGPTEIDVSLGWYEAANSVRKLQVMVQDNGVGFDPSQPPAQGHYGLQSLRQRARSCDAQLTLDAQVGKGCKLQLIFPP